MGNNEKHGFLVVNESLDGRQVLKQRLITSGRESHDLEGKAVSAFTPSFSPAPTQAF